MLEPVLDIGFKESDRAAIVALLREYWASLGVAPDFQNFDAEVANLPGLYAPPAGAMIVARAAGVAGLAGTVALRAVRGSGLGRTLALAAMAEARRLGYARMFLDTLPSLTAAQALYRTLGFRQTGVGPEAPHVLLFECDLGTG
jgi:putative acetyltransferase